MNAQQHGPTGPFLSVIVPAGVMEGEQALRETLLCLVGQDDRDFEVLVVVGGTGSRRHGGVEEVIADQPPLLASRLRLEKVAAVSPGAIRNAGVLAARGRYVTVLPEGDLVLGSWVQTFHQAEQPAERRVLRALGVAQDHGLVETAGRQAVRAEGSPSSDSPPVFSLWQHALESLSPPSTWAWPRELAVEQGLRYDEEVVDDPDWELLVRTAQLVDVTDVEVVTSVQRRWTSTSRRDVSLPTAQEVIDSRPLALPAGESGRVRAGSTESAATRELADELDRTREELRLTHDHASNLEGMVRHLEGRVVEVERRHGKEIARLRSKLAKRTEPAEQPPSGRDSGASGGSRWLKRRP